jgi:GTPase SAR1 family protein
MSRQLQKALECIRALPDAARELTLSGLGLTDADISLLACHCGRLKHLDSLDLSSNQIGAAGATAIAAGLKRLHTLDLSSNRIGDAGAVLAELPGRTQLIELRLRGCQLERLPESWKTWTSRLSVSDNPLLEIGDELARSGKAQDILTYYFSRRTRRLAAMKLLVIGDGRVGKSHLIRRLAAIPGSDDEVYFDSARSPTHAFERASLSRVRARLGDEAEAPLPIEVHVWDFGGQPHLHGSHRFFLSDDCSLFLLVLRADQTWEDQRGGYWLRFVRHAAEAAARQRAAMLGDDFREPDESASTGSTSPPILIALTRCDLPAHMHRLSLTDAFVREQALKERANVIGCVTGVGWSDAAAAESTERRHRAALADLRSRIADAAALVPRVRHRFPDDFFKLREYVHNEFYANDPKDFLGINAIRAAAQDLSVDPRYHDYYLLVLRSLGLVHYLGEHPDARPGNTLAHWVFNPDWLRTPVYDVLWARTGAHEHGVLRDKERHLEALLPLHKPDPSPPCQSDEDLARRVFRLHAFTPEHRTRVVDVMCALNLMHVLSVPEPERTRAVDYLVPDLLPVRDKEDDPPRKAPGGAERRYLEYAHVPDHALFGFLAANHDAARRGGDPRRDRIRFVWGEGGAAETVTMTAWIDSSGASVTIIASGPQTDRSVYMGDLTRHLARVCIPADRASRASTGASLRTKSPYGLQALADYAASMSPPDADAAASELLSGSLEDQSWTLQVWHAVKNARNLRGDGTVSWDSLKKYLRDLKGEFRDSVELAQAVRSRMGK